MIDELKKEIEKKNVMYDLGFYEGRKQGALEEQERFKHELKDIGSSLSEICKVLANMNRRIKELEK